jgi:hypothetical protein
MFCECATLVEELGVMEPPIDRVPPPLRPVLVLCVLLLSMCVKMSFVYFNLLVISALFDSRA